MQVTRIRLHLQQKFDSYFLLFELEKRENVGPLSMLCITLLSLILGQKKKSRILVYLV